MPVILLVGPDGTGKSTVVQWLEGHLGVARREHYRPAPPDDRRAVTTPHTREPRNLVASVIKLLLLYVEQLCAIAPRRRVSQRAVVVIERGWFDAAVDPYRYRMDPRLRGFVRLLGATMRKADVVLVLQADPVRIVERKPELTALEIDRQQRLWDELAPRTARRVVVIQTDDWDVTQERLRESLAIA